MAEYMALIGVVVTGVLGLLGYFVQRGIDRRNVLLSKKREVYADFLMVYSKSCFGDADAGHTIFHALGQIALYGSPGVVKAANRLIEAMHVQGNKETTAVPARRLLLAMRSEVAGGTPVSEQDITYLVVGGHKDQGCKQPAGGCASQASRT